MTDSHKKLACSPRLEMASDGRPRSHLRRKERPSMPIEIARNDLSDPPTISCHLHSAVHCNGA